MDDGCRSGALRLPAFDITPSTLTKLGRWGRRSAIPAFATSTLRSVSTSRFMAAPWHLQAWHCIRGVGQPDRATSTRLAWSGAAGRRAVPPLLFAGSSSASRSRSALCAPYAASRPPFRASEPPANSHFRQCPTRSTSRSFTPNSCASSPRSSACHGRRKIVAVERMPNRRHRGGGCSPTARASPATFSSTAGLSRLLIEQELEGVSRLVAMVAVRPCDHRTVRSGRTLIQ